jgi:molybdopterin molybdotransferase
VGGKRISVDEGLALIRRNIRPIATEIVPIGHALGRVTAAPLVAGRTVPGFRAAAMDGFAIRSGDARLATAEAPVRLPISGWAPAGTWPPPLNANQACSIGTGAPVPEGADSVVMSEHAPLLQDATGSSILIAAPATPGLNVRQIGEDVTEGREILRAGVVVTPDIIAGLAAYGLSHIEVFRAPTLAVIVTGSELAGKDRPVADGASIIDCNGPMIAAYAASIGANIRPLGIVEDAAKALDKAFDRACSTDADMVITTGGASHGEHDFLRAALERRSAAIIFHGLSMRPGKPILFAILPDGRPFFGLPGNPVSACIGMRFFVAQALRAMCGLPDEKGAAAVSGEEGREDITLFLRGRIDRSADLGVRIDTGLDQRSHILSSLMAADSWLRVDRVNGDTRHLAFAKQLSFF